MNARSIKRLEDAHLDLETLMIEASKACPVPFEISEVKRTGQRQAALVRAGASKTMNSRHLTGHAADIVCYVDGRVRWDWPLYKLAADHIKATALRLGIPIVWGGDWRTLKDGPHFELDRKTYP